MAGGCGRSIGHDHVLVLGDSVVWGEYVAPDGTLSHFLNQEARATNRFVNLGLNGLFPLAQEGLVDYYCQTLRHQKVIVQCNVLWMTSPKADLSSAKEEPFNHSRLVPQFWPRIPCYRADANERLSAVIQREVGFLQWVGHLQNAYFDQMSILSWTLQDDGGSPPRYPNVYKDPLAQISLTVPSAPQDDPQRGPKSPRHKPWSLDGQGTTRFEWVDLDASLQWHAFQRMIGRLRERGNDVLVVLGPFNEHLMAEDNRPAYRKIRDGIAAWLGQNQVPAVVPDVLAQRAVCRRQPSADGGIRAAGQTHLRRRGFPQVAGGLGGPLISDGPGGHIGARHRRADIPARMGSSFTSH